MQVKTFIDKYDKEFVNLMLEIDKRIQFYSKNDKLKINSWVRTLCLPTTNRSWKKNRNLYAILLLDSILNNKINPPFNKFAKENNDLPVLNPTEVKSLITKKFYDEINFDNDEQIQNFINLNYLNNNEQNNILNTDNNKNNYNYNNNNKYYNLKENNNNKNNLITKNRVYDNNYYTINHSDYNTNIFIENNKNNKSNRPKSSLNIIKSNNNLNFNLPNNEEKYLELIKVNDKNIDNNSDILLKKKYFGLKEKLGNEEGFKTKAITNFNKLEKYKLNSIISSLNNENIIKNKIIEKNKKEIYDLKIKIKLLEKKVLMKFS